MAASIEARIRADGSVSYRVRFRITKGANPVVETFDEYADAQDFVALVEQVGGAEARKIRTATTVVRTVSTVETALEQYVAHVETYAAKGTGWEYRRVAERTWLPSLGKLPVQSLTRERIEQWVVWQRDQLTVRGRPFSPKTIRNAQGLLSSVLEYQIEKGVIGSNPAKGVKIARDAARTEMTFLTPEQFTRVLAELPEKWHPLFVLLFSTGLRWGEVTALERGDFSLETEPATVRVSRAWKRGPQGRKYLGAPKSRAAYRTITLPDSTVNIMTPVLEKMDHDDDLVFPAARAGQDHQLHEGHVLLDVWRPACVRAGIGAKVRLHDLRHSHASVLIAAGVPLPVIQRRLGHESIKTTVDTYGHLSQESWAGAATAMDLALAPALPRLT